jgi:hypothetical protein
MTSTRPAAQGRNRAAQLPVARPYDTMIASLKAEHGTAFDRDYVNAQVDHQRGNAALFQYEIQNGTDPDLKEFARRTLPKIEDYLQRALRLAKNSKLGTSVFKTRRLLSLLKVAHREMRSRVQLGSDSEPSQGEVPNTNRPCSF